MSQEQLQTLGEMLGLLVITEQKDAALKLNHVAVTALPGSTPAANLEETLMRLLDRALTSDALALNTMLSEARSKGTASLELSDKTRIIAFKNQENLLTVWVDRRAFDFERSLRERIVAADLAAGVSHEVSNALSSIIGWARIASERPDKAPPEEAFAMIEQSAHAARTVAQDLLRSVRNSVEEENRCNVATVVMDVVRLLRPEALRRRVQITQQVEEGCWVAAKRSQIFSVVWNLAHNASQMVPPGGFIFLRVDSSDGKIQLEVRDNGPGMTEDQRQKAFNASFTTRKGGTGLGLVIVRKNVEAMGGTIKLETAPGSGASFRIDLPRLNYSVDSTTIRKTTRVTRVLESLNLKNRRVLVVEDDQGVRELIATTLELSGLEVVSAKNAKEATRVEGPFAIAVLDLNLPDNRGDLLLATLREQKAVDLAIIMTGGAPPEDADSRGVPESWLRKPFEPTEMLGRIRDVLEAVADPSRRESIA